MEISNVSFLPRHVRITVRFRHHLYSSQVNHLGKHLLTMLPSLREHLCYNRSGLPFTEEVHDTEMGHVFEHVVLALLQERDIFTKGQTVWNWRRDPIGTYQVTISTGKRLAIKESILIAQAILTNALIEPVIKFSLPVVSRHSKSQPLPLYIQTADAAESDGRMLFAAEHRPLFESDAAPTERLI